MLGLEIVALVCGAIAACKALPEIPSVWRRFVKSSKKRLKSIKDDKAVQIRSPSVVSPSHPRIIQNLSNIIASHRQAIQTLNNDRYVSHAQTVELMRDILSTSQQNHSDIVSSHQQTIRILDNNRHLSHSRTTKLMGEILRQSQNERVVLCNRVRSDTNLIINLLILLAVCAFFLGRANMESTYLRYILHSRDDKNAEPPWASSLTLGSILMFPVIAILTLTRWLIFVSVQIGGTLAGIALYGLMIGTGMELQSGTYVTTVPYVRALVVAVAGLLCFQQVLSFWEFPGTIRVLLLAPPTLFVLASVWIEGIDFQ